MVRGEMSFSLALLPHTHTIATFIHLSVDMACPYSKYLRQILRRSEGDTGDIKERTTKTVSNYTHKTF